MSGVVEAVEPRPAPGREQPVSVVIRTEDDGEEMRLPVLPAGGREGGRPDWRPSGSWGSAGWTGTAPRFYRRLKAGAGKAGGAYSQRL